MKKIKIAAVITAFAAMLASFTACSNTQTNSSSADDKNYTIGVIQFGSHASLDNCYDGIVKGLEASSYGKKITIDKQDGGFDSTTCDTIANSMVSKKYDLIFAIATPAAVSAYSAARTSNTPVIFCAVSDPVQAGLTESFEKGTKNCIGTSDVLDFNAQLDIIQAMQPNAKKIGVLYTTTEANSLSQLKEFKEIAGKRGLEVIEQGVSGAADIPQAATTVAAKVDCINNFTDNNVVNNLTVVLEKANAANIPVYGSEIEQVKKGCLASASIDYVALGKTTAELAVKVLDGTKPDTMAVGTISEAIPVVNTDVATKFGLTIPESFSNAEKVTTETAAE